jgi:hypothetical protein
MPLVSIDLNRGTEPLAECPVLACEHPPIFLGDELPAVADEPTVHLGPGIDLAHVGLIPPIAGLGKHVHVFYIIPLVVGERQREMAAGVQEGEHRFHGLVVLGNVLQDTDARDEIELPVEFGLANVVIDDMIVPIKHSNIPVVTDVIYGRDKDTTISQELWK